MQTLHTSLSSAIEYTVTHHKQNSYLKIMENKNCIKMNFWGLKILIAAAFDGVLDVSVFSMKIISTVLFRTQVKDIINFR